MKLVTTHRVLAAATLLAALAAAPAAVHAQVFLPGDILVNEYAAGSVQRYSALGTLTQTYTTGFFYAEGASVTPDGNLVTDGFNNDGASTTVNRFTPAGTRTTFTATGNPFAGDVSVFASGTLAVSNQDYGTVQLFSPSGTLLHTVTGTGDPFGSTVGSNGELYVVDASGYYLNAVSESGNLDSRVHLSFAPADLVMNPADGTLWVSDYSDNTVKHIDTRGNVLGSFATGQIGTEGIALSNDDLSLYVTGYNSSTIKQFALNGTLLSTINLTNASEPVFITVVPVLSGISGAPEPGTWVTLLGGLGLLGGAQRLRRAPGLAVPAARRSPPGVQGETARRAGASPGERRTPFSL